MRRVSRVQRLARKEEGDIIKRIVLLSVLSVIIIVLIFTLGIPFLGGFANLLNRFFHGQTTVSTSPLVLAAPVLDSLPSATNSASLPVTGVATDGNKVEIFLNSNKVGETNVTDGKFQYASVNLSSGDNQISAKALNSSGKESDFSETSSITLDTTAPQLAVDSPSDGQSFSGVNKILVRGTADPNAEVLANGFLANVGNDGKWSVSIPLSDGDNAINVKAIDNAGNTTEVKVKVSFHP